MVLGAGHKAAINTSPFPALLELTLQWGELGNKSLQVVLGIVREIKQVRKYTECLG